jgi:O-antigen ligase
MIQTRQLNKGSIGFSGNVWGPGSFLLGVLLVAVAAALVVYTRRIELAGLVALPIALLLLSNFRLAATVSVWVVLIWLLRLPQVFFDFLQFSYVVYGSLAVTLGAYVLRVGLGGRQTRLPIITNKWIWLLMGTVMLGGVHGARSVGDIPPWLLINSDIDLGVAWTYYRTVVFPGVLLPLLAIIIAGALCDKQKLTAICTPVWTMVLLIDLLIVGSVAASGDALSVMATLRSEHLTNLGFHSNELGAFLAIAYGLGLGMWDGAERGRSRKALGALLALTVVALLLTFSRGAYLGFAVTTIVVFLGGAPKKQAAFLVLTALLWFAAPAPLVDRIEYGLTSKDVNEISAGRVDNLWLPLLPDIANHLWFGQGLQSIMWTDAQRFQEIFPANLAHNAFLDLVLDFGVIGALPILAWYAYFWSGLRRGASRDPDPQYRALFVGGELALLAFFLSSLTNNRLTPMSTNCLLWVVAGVLLGRARQRDGCQAQAVSDVAGQKSWRPLVSAPRGQSRTLMLDGV